MFLSEDDIKTYAPDFINEINCDSLEGQIQYVLSIVESAQGANRPIQITEFNDYVSYIYLKPGQPYHLSYCPFVTEDGYEPIVKIRSGCLPHNRQIAPYINSTIVNNSISFSDRSNNGYQTLSSEEYIIENDKLIILRQTIVQDLDITYKAGLDLSLDNHEVRSFKANFCHLMNFIYKSASYSGISDVQLPYDEARIKFNNSGVKPFDIPDNLLIFFHKYRPIVNPN